MYQVISSGSKGNAVIYHGSIMVDCGVPYSALKPYVKGLKVVLLTHRHLDHFNIATIRRLSFERPSLRFGAGEWMLPLLDGIRNVDILTIGQLYDYGQLKLQPVKLYHDVPNCGYRIFANNTKIFHATDTAHLKGITATNYDLYAIEYNYDEDTIYDIIEQQIQRGQYAYQKGSINSHLSEQQAKEFIFKNRGEHSQILRLHETSTLSII